MITINLLIIHSNIFFQNIASNVLNPMKEIWHTHLQCKGKDSLKRKVKKIKSSMLLHVAEVSKPLRLGVIFCSSSFVISLLQERRCNLWNLLRGCQIKSQSQWTKIWNPKWVCFFFSCFVLWILDIFTPKPVKREVWLKTILMMLVVFLYNNRKTWTARNWEINVEYNFKQD